MKYIIHDTDHQIIVARNTIVSKFVSFFEKIYIIIPVTIADNNGDNNIKISKLPIM